MPRLTEAVRALVVTELAYFRTPSEVADIVKEQTGVMVDRRHIQTYDPTRAGQKPAAKWCALFTAARQAFLERFADQAIASRSWRLRELEDIARAAKRQKNFKLAMECLEQAAKEVGGVYDAPRAKDTPDSDERKAARIRTLLSEMDAVTAGRMSGTGAAPSAHALH